MLWVVKQRHLWGDYGDILISGLVNRKAETGPLLLHRTGPFLPPIFFPWLPVGGTQNIVSNLFRHELEESGIPGLHFKPVVKAHIVKLRWHEWDRHAEEPGRYPPEGEPEGYLLDKPHDTRIAAQMPEAWELCPPLVPLRTENVEDPNGGYKDEYRAYLRQANYPGLFLSRHVYGELVVDDAVRSWFESRVGDWVRFCQIIPVAADPGLV